MTDKPMISIDGEWLLERIQDLEIIINEIRSIASRGTFVQQTPEGIDLDAIDWKVKDSKPFTAGDPWGWAFAYDQEGDTLNSTRELVNLLKSDLKVTIDGYVIKLSGRGGKLLSRNKVKR